MLISETINIIYRQRKLTSTSEQGPREIKILLETNSFFPTCEEIELLIQANLRNTEAYIARGRICNKGGWSY